MSDTFSKPARIVLWILGILFAVVMIVLVAVNLFVKITYASFYEAAENEFPIPGISNGFIPQDLDYMAAIDGWLFSGYMTDGSPSPIMKRDHDGNIATIYVETPEGTPYEDHGSAITSTDEFSYLACEGGYYVLDSYDVANAADGSTIHAIQKVDLEFSPAFMNIQHDTLYAGVFYRPGNYETPEEQHITTPDGTQNYAIMYAYPADEETDFDFATHAAAAYSIPAQVQGMSLTDDGRFVFSTSYGLATSHLYVYDAPTYDGESAYLADGENVALLHFDGTNLVEDIEAPPMTEGIDVFDGKIWISEESASNKYLFGKLYDAGCVYALTLPEA